MTGSDTNGLLSADVATVLLMVLYVDSLLHDWLVKTRLLVLLSLPSEQLGVFHSWSQDAQGSSDVSEENR